jgi:hypothetical protein
VSGPYAYLVTRGDTPVQVNPVPRGLATRREEVVSDGSARAGAADPAEDLVAGGADVAASADTYSQAHGLGVVALIARESPSSPASRQLRP